MVRAHREPPHSASCIVRSPGEHHRVDPGKVCLCQPLHALASAGAVWWNRTTLKHRETAMRRAARDVPSSLRIAFAIRARMLQELDRLMKQRFQNASSWLHRWDEFL